MRTGEGVGRSLPGTSIQGSSSEKSAKYLSRPEGSISSPEGGTTILDTSGDGQVYRVEPVRELGTRARREQDRRVAQAREEQQRSASLVFPSHPPKPGCRRVRGHAGGVTVVTHLTGVVLFICGGEGVSSHNNSQSLLGRVPPANHRSWAHDSAPPATSRVWGGM